MDDYVRQELQRVLDQAVAEKEIPYGSLLVRKDGKELCYLEQGVKRDGIFRMYSMTKPVTSAAVMKLMEQGRLEYSDPVSKFLPGFAGQKALCQGKIVEAERELTIRDLMCMTSGLVYGDYPGPAGEDTKKVFDEIDRRLFTDNPMTTVEAVNALGKGVLNFQPGESWNYGTSADVLGAIVELVSGRRYSEFLQKEFFEPLEMEDTGFYVKEEKRHRLMTSYQRSEDGGLIPYYGNYLGIINAMDRAPAFESGGAGLTSTVDDYSHFADMLLQGGNYKGRQILRERTVKFMTAPKLNERQKQNLGWGIDYEGFNYGNLMRILEDDRRASIMGSNEEYGWDGWMGTCFTNSPAEHMTILFMTQRTECGWLSVIKKLRNILFSVYGES